MDSRPVVSALLETETDDDISVVDKTIIERSEEDVGVL